MSSEGGDRLRLGSEPALPCEEPRYPHTAAKRAHLGLSKREQIAALTLQTLLQLRTLPGTGSIITQAVGYADALLEELAK